MGCCWQVASIESKKSPQPGPGPTTLSALESYVGADRVRAALQGARRITQRVRKLPLERVVVFVVAMSLFRSHSMEHLALMLGLASSAASALSIASSSLVEARDRVGSEPMRLLFNALASDIIQQQSVPTARWRNLTLWAVDGSSLRVADSKENRREFGGHSGGARGDSAYPLVRMVVLMALSSRQIVQAAFGPFRKGELTLAQPIWGALPNNSLVIVDRNFYSASILHSIQSGGDERHWLLRLKKNARYTIVKSLGNGDWLVRVLVSKSAKKKDSSLPDYYNTRIINYQIPGFRAQKLMTSLLDGVKFPASEITGLYHLRWDIELGLDEIKTELLDRRESLRSRTPERVRQEIWGLFLAHNLVRTELCTIARSVKLPPSRISFIGVLRRIRVYCVVIIFIDDHDRSRQVSRYLAEIQSLVLRPRRSERSYPRAVKIKMSSYPKKRPPASTSDQRNTAEIAG